jgi:hypothetical protein
MALEDTRLAGPGRDEGIEMYIVFLIISACIAVFWGVVAYVTAWALDAPHPVAWLVVVAALVIVVMYSLLLFNAGAHRGEI